MYGEKLIIFIELIYPSFKWDEAWNTAVNTCRDINKNMKVVNFPLIFGWRQRVLRLDWEGKCVPLYVLFYAKKGKDKRMKQSQTILISVKIYVQRTAVTIATEMETSLQSQKELSERRFRSIALTINGYRRYKWQVTGLYIIYRSTYFDVSFIADQLTGTVIAHFLF